MSEVKQIGFFEKYLTLWVLICIVVGIAVGKIAGSSMQVLIEMNVFDVNLPVAILVWYNDIPHDGTN